MSERDPTNPSYYTKGIEPIAYADSHAYNLYQHNVLKYVTRYREKNGVEDLKKARWYLDRLIKNEGMAQHDGS